VILRQEQHEREQFIEPISFFWTCLSELQRGCNFGLQNPLNILRKRVHEFQFSIPEGIMGGNDVSGVLSLDETGPPFRSQQPADRSALSALLPGEETDYMGTLDQPDLTLSNSSPGFLVSLNQLESDISEDALFGLFAPSQTFP
jgi:hypothetical protein